MKTVYYKPLNSELYHHGIKGQKWGIRRSEKQLSRVRGRKEDVHDDYKKAHDKKSVKSMSDQELRERNNRLQMEAQYKRMSGYTTTGEKITKAAKVFMTGATIAAGVVTAYGTYKTLAKKAANTKIGKATTDKAFDKIGDWVLKGIDMKQRWD